MIYVHDDVMSWPVEYRERALQRTFGTFLNFRGIAPCDNGAFPFWLSQAFDGLSPSLSFFRRSPRMQEEPNFVHTDADMGDWTAILYLTPEPPDDDGTVFYDYPAGEVFGWKNPPVPLGSLRVPARFNRAVVFPASLYHSRAIPENYGDGDAARLTQVMFGTGQLPRAAEKGVTWQ